MPSRSAHRRPLLLALCLTAAACVQAPAPTAEPPRPAGRRDARSIGLPELTAVQRAGAAGSSAYEVVRRLRPEFLWLRHPSAMHPAGHAPAVYLDGLYQGDPETLHSLPASAVARIAYLTRTEAAHRFGGGHDHRGGAILVWTRKG